MYLTPNAVLEVSQLIDHASVLARGNSNERAESAVMLARIKNIRETGESSDETRAKYAVALAEETKISGGRVSEQRYQKVFDKYLYASETALSESEQRDLLAGTTSITASTGNLGGYLIPFQYSAKLFAAMAQIDPLLSPQVCDFTVADSPTLQPMQISGYDLTQIEATLIAESAQQNAGVFPAVNGRVLRSSITYRLSLAASFEAEDDVPGTMGNMSGAFGVGLARRLGADAVNGNSITQPQGLTVALPTPTTTSLYPNNATYGSGFVPADFSNLYFACNAIHRASALYAWLCSDSVYERIRKTPDPAGRPLINLENDRMLLLGKPIYICPSLPVVGGSPAQSSTIFFGDLSAFKIRCSKPTLQRAINLPNYIEYGKALYIARMRMDSAYFDPSNGAVPPIVSMMVQA
jgi:HK97 family phage major capsid protein